MRRRQRQRVLRHQSKGGELAAGQCDQARFVAHHMVARGFGRILLAVVNDRPHAGIAGADVSGRDVCGGELVVHGVEQIRHLGRGNACLNIQVQAVVQVRSTHQHGAFPRVEEHRPAILGMHEADALRHRQAPERQHQVAAAQRAQQRRGADAGAQAVGPCAGGVDDGAGLHGVGLAGQAVFAHHAGDLSVCRLQAFNGHVVEQRGAIALRFEQHAPDQAGVVGLGVREHQGTAQARRCQARRQGLRGGQVSVVVALLPGHQVVHP